MLYFAKIFALPLGRRLSGQQWQPGRSEGSEESVPRTEIELWSSIYSQSLTELTPNYRLIIVIRSKTTPWNRKVQVQRRYYKSVIGQATPALTTCLPENGLYAVLSCASHSSKRMLFKRFLHQESVFPILATCPVRCSLARFTTLRSLHEPRSTSELLRFRTLSIVRCSKPSTSKCYTPPSTATVV
jgi:hypothetical protein